MTPCQVLPYVDRVIEFSDTNRKSLGFLQKAVFREQANRGRLWVAVSSDTNECVGYLLFGGSYPTLKVFQLYVEKKCRKFDVGKKLLISLVTWGEKYSFSNIFARVAADLPSNRFWEQVGFSLVRQEAGGKSSGRIINIRVRELNTPSLLDLMPCKASGAKIGIEHIHLQQPILGVQTYVLDLNILFDVVKKRVHRTEGAKLINAGLDQQARLVVTPELIRELERNSDQNRQDPILEFARTLPVLPEIPTEEIDSLLCEIQPVVFPSGTQSRHEVQSVSDLIHLAYCIYHRITGFITREKAMLAVSEQLLDSYHLEVLSPMDLFQPSIAGCRSRVSLQARFGKEDISVVAATETDRSEVERFLIGRGVLQSDLATIWSPGTIATPRSRMIARVGVDLIAVASWDGPSSFSRPTMLHLYVDETSYGVEAVIDHVLESVLRDTQPLSVRIVILDAPIDQPKTRTTAAKRGFIKSFPGGLHSTAGQLCKLTFSGLISSNNWDVFRNEVKKAAHLHFPMRIPTFEEFMNTGIVIKNESDKFLCNLSLFDFETLVSPGVVLCPGRAALIVPIKLQFAKGLFANVQAQGFLFPAPEALLHVEKAYFKSTRGASKFTLGTLVLFYLSGSGNGTKEVIGCARLTYTDVLSVDEVELKLKRQGVLSRSELEGIANSSGKLHVFTFDNFNEFPTRIPFSFLKDMSMISGANLITTEQLSARDCAQVCEFGYGLRSRTDA